MEQLIRMIACRDLEKLYKKEQSDPKEPFPDSREIMLEVKGLYSRGASDISFKLKKEEILGIAGLMGSGRTAIAHAIAGMEKITAGAIWLKGNPVRIDSPRADKKHGNGVVTENRKQLGLITDASKKQKIVHYILKKHIERQKTRLN